MRKNSPHSVETLAVLDIQLVVFFLQTLDDALSQNRDSLNDLNEQLKQRIKDLEIISRNSDIECTGEFASDIEEYLGFNSTLDLFKKAMQQKYNEKGFDEDLDKIRADIETTENFISKAEDADNKVKKALVSFLNARGA